MVSVVAVSFVVPLAVEVVVSREQPADAVVPQRGYVGACFHVLYQYFVAAVAVAVSAPAAAVVSATAAAPVNARRRFTVSLVPSSPDCRRLTRPTMDQAARRIQDVFAVAKRSLRPFE
jgi:hypothetical protein